MVDNKVLTKVVILGNLGVGKTRLMNVYCGDNDESTVTVAQDCRKMEEKVGATNVTLQLWDTAGQEKYNSINFSFYRGANCCILVFDITDVESFERLNKWKTNFVDAVNPSESDNFPYIVVGQKLDLEAERKVSEADARAWCESQKIKNYFETSAQENKGVAVVFKKAAELAAEANKADDFSMPAMGNMMNASLKMSVAGDKKATEAKIQQKQKKKCC